MACLYKVMNLNYGFERHDIGVYTLHRTLYKITLTITVFRLFLSVIASPKGTKTNLHYFDYLNMLIFIQWHNLFFRNTPPQSDGLPSLVA